MMIAVIKKKPNPPCDLKKPLCDIIASLDSFLSMREKLLSCDFVCSFGRYDDDFLAGGGTLKFKI